MNSLLDFLRSAREPRTAASLWEEIGLIRRTTKNAMPDLPHEWPELERLLRHMKVAGLVNEEGGLWSVRVRMAGKVQQAMF